MLLEVQEHLVSYLLHDRISLSILQHFRPDIAPLLALGSFILLGDSALPEKLHFSVILLTDSQLFVPPQHPIAGQILEDGDPSVQLVLGHRNLHTSEVEVVIHTGPEVPGPGRRLLGLLLLHLLEAIYLCILYLVQDAPLL